MKILSQRARILEHFLLLIPNGLLETMNAFVSISCNEYVCFIKFAFKNTSLQCVMKNTTLKIPSNPTIPVRLHSFHVFYSSIISHASHLLSSPGPGEWPMRSTSRGSQACGFWLASPSGEPQQKMGLGKGGERDQGAYSFGSFPPCVASCDTEPWSSQGSSLYATLSPSVFWDLLSPSSICA